MHYEYILTLILKNSLCLLHDFNQFYKERYVKFSVYKNRSEFCFFPSIDVDATVADTMQFYNKDFGLYFMYKRCKYPPPFPFFQP